MSSLEAYAIHLPSVYVQRLILGATYEEHRVPDGSRTGERIDSWDHDEMAGHGARELKAGFYVNFRSGIPPLGANHVAAGVAVTLQSENGMLCVGPFPYDDKVDPDLTNAGQRTVSELAYTAYPDSAQICAMVRGGHIDPGVLGPMEVARNGDTANWMILGKMIKGMGGAMNPDCRDQEGHRRDGAQRRGRLSEVHRRMHAAAHGQERDRLVTNIAVFACEDHTSPFRLVELASGGARMKSTRKPQPSMLSNHSISMVRYRGRNQSMDRTQQGMPAGKQIQIYSQEWHLGTIGEAND